MGVFYADTGIGVIIQRFKLFSVFQHKAGVVLLKLIFNFTMLDSKHTIYCCNQNAKH